MLEYALAKLMARDGLKTSDVDYAQPIPLRKFIDYSFLDAALKRIDG